MLDVELVEEPEDGRRPPPDPSGHDAPRAPGRAPGQAPVDPRERRAMRLRATAVVVATTSLALGWLTLRDAAAVRQDDAQVEAAADSPRLVPTLRTPLREQWRAPADAVVVGDLVLAAEAFQGTVRTIARDVATGALRWVMSRSLTPANRAPLCRSLGSDRATLACELPGRPGIEAANTDQALGSTPGRLITLDSATGATVDLSVLPVGSVGWEVTEGDLVTARLADGSLVVERIDQPAREQRWIGAVPLAAGALARQLRLRVEDGFVLVDGVAGAVLDAETGHVLASPPAGADGVVQLSSGRLGFTVWHGTTGTWHDRLGRPGALLSGVPQEVAVDDGSGEAFVIVRSGPSIVALDAIDAGPAWSRGSIDRALLRLDGLVLLEGVTVLHAVDAVSGATRWTAETRAGPPGSVVVSDGLRVLTVVPGDGTTTLRMVALDLADGHVVWSAPLPAGTTAVSALDGTVVAVGPDAVVVLG